MIDWPSCPSTALCGAPPYATELCDTFCCPIVLLTEKKPGLHWGSSTVVFPPPVGTGPIFFNHQNCESVLYHVLQLRSPLNLRSKNAPTSWLFLSQHVSPHRVKELHPNPCSSHFETQSSKALNCRESAWPSSNTFSTTPHPGGITSRPSANT